MYENRNYIGEKYCHWTIVDQMNKNQILSGKERSVPHFKIQCDCGSTRETKRHNFLSRQIHDRCGYCMAEYRKTINNI